MEIEEAGYYSWKGQTVARYWGNKKKKKQDTGEKYMRRLKNVTWSQGVGVPFCHL